MWRHSKAKIAKRAAKAIIQLSLAVLPTLNVITIVSGNGFVNWSYCVVCVGTPSFCGEKGTCDDSRGYPQCQCHTGFATVIHCNLNKLFIKRLCLIGWRWALSCVCSWLLGTFSWLSQDRWKFEPTFSLSSLFFSFFANNVSSNSFCFVFYKQWNIGSIVTIYIEWYWWSWLWWSSSFTRFVENMFVFLKKKKISFIIIF